MEGDTLVIGEELHKILNDDEYRNSIFPEIYTWEQVIAFLENQEMKKAFWFFINLYPENDRNRELVIKSIMTYDQVLEMDVVMMNTFYTYAFVDPIVCVINDAKPEIVRPDILETKLNTVQQIIANIFHFRENPDNE